MQWATKRIAKEVIMNTRAASIDPFQHLIVVVPVSTKRCIRHFVVYNKSLYDFITLFAMGLSRQSSAGIQPTVAIDGTTRKPTKPLSYFLKGTQHTAVQYVAYVDTHYHFRLSC